MRSAHIENGTVIGVRDGDWSGEPGYVLLNAGEIVARHMGYDESRTPRFYPKPILRPAPSWTAFHFLLRFTEAEREAFRAAALTDPKVADFIQLCGAASEVEANHPMTVAGMEYLVDQGLLTQARSYEVLGL
jgi:hypothetical protein